MVLPATTAEVFWLNPMTAGLLDTDVTEAFMRRGGLYVPGGDDIVEFIKNRVHPLFPVCRRWAAIDRHKWGSVSYASSFIGYAWYYKLTAAEVATWTETNHRIAPHALFTLAELKEYLAKVGYQTLWPDHARENTFESELHPAFHESDYRRVLIKGMNPAHDSNSALVDNFGDSTGLGEEMLDDGVEDLWNTGLAEDVCVGWGLLHAVDMRHNGKRFKNVYLFEQATRAIDYEGSKAAMRRRFADAGIKIVHNIDQVRLAA